MTAIISECGTYRYRLERELQLVGIVVAFFGVNPSWADSVIPDQTDMKWRGFGKLLGARKYIAGNPFAFRAREVRDLAKALDPIGPFNDMHLGQIIGDADLLVPCWGDRAKLPAALRPHLDVLARRIHGSGKPVKVFGFTKSGDPKHPLMLGYDTELMPWAA
ncbi:DUF1643 domain-containing protein [Paraburkholderia sp. C35]|uniref:DUF1643 domain-containing protein n=1 Tax=Paraburkholderia sp. C35 TaxID=2126993 RepID=UPI000D69F7D0|nr:DUF1643 domain-containing protein [Paraburkholderia sp. C35]